MWTYRDRPVSSHNLSVPAKSLACFVVTGILTLTALAKDERGFVSRWLFDTSVRESALRPYSGRIALNRPSHFPTKVVALTFDDGPDPSVTPRILDTLAKYHAKATFFVVGRCAIKYPELLKRIVAEGHVIGNRSYSHPSKVSAVEAVKQIDETSKAIKAATGRTPTLFRPPYGIQSGEMVKYAKSKSYAIVLWNLTSADTATKDSNVIARNVAYTPDPGDIALMHDGSGHSPTADALPKIMEKLAKDGFEFVTVPDLLERWTLFANNRRPIVARNHMIVASRSKSSRKTK